MSACITHTLHTDMNVYLCLIAHMLDVYINYQCEINNNKKGLWILRSASNMQVLLDQDQFTVVTFCGR
jgi:hypothetical protein